MPEYELLELLLFNAIQRIDVKPLAKRLLAEFGDLNGVIAASKHRVLQVEGANDWVYYHLRVVEAFGRRMAQAKVMQRDVVSSWEALVTYCRTAMAHREVEQFRVMFLDRKNVLIADEEQARGTVDHVLVYAPARANIGEDFALRGFAMCGDCGKPLRSSWPKGKYKRYAYYLCQTKGCDSYGKSIPRDKLEGAFGEVVKTLEPSPKLFQMATVMFKDAWAARLGQAKDATQSVRRQIADTEKQIENLLDRIMSASSDSVIGAYENKIARLERDKHRLTENLINQMPPRGRFEDMLELSLQFLSSSWKLWESGDFILRRTLLRLAFTSGFSYHRNEGARTPEISLPFKALGVFSGGGNLSGASRGTRTPDLVLTKDLLYQLSY